MASDDGSLLYINGRRLVNNDGTLSGIAFSRETCHW